MALSLPLRSSFFILPNGRFYARDVEVVKTSLTSKTLKPSGIRTGRKIEDDLTEENEIFLKNGWLLFSEDTGLEKTWRQTLSARRLINAAISASQIYFSMPSRKTRILSEEKSVKVADVSSDRRR